MRLKHDWQVESWVLGGGGVGGAVVWYPVRRVSLSDKSSRRSSQKWPSVCEQETEYSEGMDERKLNRQRTSYTVAHYAWSNQTYTDT